MLTFKQFISEARKPRNPKRNVGLKRSEQPDHYLHIGSDKLKPGEDLKPSAKLHGTGEAFRRFVDKWKPWDSPGMRKSIKKHIKRVHVVRAGDLNVKPGFDPKENSDEGLGRHTALYKITPDKKLHKKMEWNTQSDIGFRHPMVKRIKSKYITHKWNVEKGAWEDFK